VAIQASCPECAKTFTLRDDFAGKTVRCKGCAATFVVAGPRPAAAPVSARAGHAEAPADDEEKVPRRQDQDDESDGEPVGKKGKSPRPRETPTGKVLMIVGGLYLLLALPPAIGFYLVTRAATKAVSSLADDQKAMAEFDKALQAQWGDEAKPPTLDQILQDLRGSDRYKRSSAAMRLSHTAVEPGRQAEVARELEKLLAPKDETVNAAAMGALKTWADRDSVPAIVAALADEGFGGMTPDARRDGLAALGRLKDGRGAATAVNYLNKPFVDEDAFQALRAMGPVAEPAVLAGYFHADGRVSGRARKLLQEYGTRPEAILRQAVTDLVGDNDASRQQAADWLAMQPANPEVRDEVSRGLNRLIASPDGRLRDTGLKATSTWGTAENVPALLDLLAVRTDDRFVTRPVIKLLGKLKDPRAAAPLVARLDRTWEHADLEEALVALGKAAAEPELTPHQNDPNRNVASIANRILRRLGSTAAAAPPAGPATLDQLIEDLKAGGTRAQTAARRLAVRPLEQARQKDVSQALEKALKDSDPQTRIDAVRALGVWADKGGVMAVAGVVFDPNHDLRHAALHALGQLKDSRTCDAVFARWLVPEDRGAARASFEAMGPVAESAVRRGLDNPSQSYQIEACQILKKIGTKASVPSLSAVMTLAARGRHHNLEAAARDAMTMCNVR
jgi:HEAT repeat protein